LLLGLIFSACLVREGSAQDEPEGSAEETPSEDAVAEEQAEASAVPEAGEEAAAEEGAAAEDAGEAAAEATEAAPPAAAEGKAEETTAATDATTASSTSEEEECEIVEDAGEKGSEVEDILALGDKKCKKKEGLSGAAALAAELFECDMDGMDEKLAGCMGSLDSRVKTLEQAVLSGEGGGLEDQITLVLVKKGVIDCENDTQCADDRACIDSYAEPGRQLCEKPCERTRCDVPYSQCIAKNHKPSCECKEEFHGNGTVACIPNGFEEQNNSRSYRMFDDKYVTFENATQQCQDLGARLPVLDSDETIDIIKNYLETYNFSVFEEQWDRSSRRIWLGLVLDRASGLVWADGQRVINYPASSRLFVWEARRMLSQEVSYADNSRHYALYIDGDLAKLPGGGRKGAAVLCELVPSQLQEPTDTYRDARYGHSQAQQQYPAYPGDGGYPNYQRGG